jgi:hypothetical protein
MTACICSSFVVSIQNLNHYQNTKLNLQHSDGRLQMFIFWDRSFVAPSTPRICMVVDAAKMCFYVLYLSCV